MAGILKFELDRAFKNRRMGRLADWLKYQPLAFVGVHCTGEGLCQWGRLSSVIFQQMDGWGELLLPGFFVFYVAAHALRASPQYKFCI